MVVYTEVRLLNQKGEHWFKTLLDHGRNWGDLQRGSRSWKGLTFVFPREWRTLKPPRWKGKKVVEKGSSRILLKWEGTKNQLYSDHVGAAETPLHKKADFTMQASHKESSVFLSWHTPVLCKCTDLIHPLFMTETNYINESGIYLALNLHMTIPLSDLIASQGEALPPTQLQLGNQSSCSVRATSVLPDRRWRMRWRKRGGGEGRGQKGPGRGTEGRGEGNGEREVIQKG